MTIDIKKEKLELKNKERLLKKLIHKEKEVKQKEAIYLKSKNELELLFKEFQGEVKND